MFDRYKNYKDIKMPKDMRDAILESMSGYKPAAKPKLAVKRRILICAAMFVFMTLAVSAAVIINRTQYVPFVGFTDEEYEVYSAPDSMPLLGKVITVEAVVRTKIGGKNDLSVIIAGTSDKTLKIVTEDYGEFKTRVIREYGQFDYGFLIEDFPEINEFKLENGGRSVDVKLELSTRDVQIVEKNGVRIRMFNLSNKGRIYTFDIEEYNIDIGKLFDIECGEPEIIQYRDGSWSIIPDGDKPYIEKYAHFYNMEMYDEYGNQCYGGSRSSSSGSTGESIMFMGRQPPEEKVAKMVISGVDVRCHFSPYNANDINIYADIDITIPAQDEIIEYKDGLVIYNKNGLSYVIYSIERKKDKRGRDEITISGRTEYTGEGSENIKGIYIQWGHENKLSSNGGWWNHETGDSGSIFNLIDDEQDIKSIRLKLSAVNYQVQGEWEIYFD